MAAPLQRFGRLTSLKKAPWSILRSGTAAEFCTKSGDGKAGKTQEQARSGAAAAEPHEPFDNSTYKNLQHHSYTPYTFADLDLEMAQYRLPQPSSGRPSPRH